MFARSLRFYTKYFAIWIVLFGIAAYLFPAPFAALNGYKKLFFALTMFGIGAVLQVDDFRTIVARPVIVLIGCCSQFTIMPLGAFILAKAFRLPPDITVGLILTGSAPGAMASNVMSYIAKADTAYSVSLTTVSTLLCPLLTPGLTLILAGSVIKVPFFNMVLDVTLMVVVPLFVGFGVRHYFGKARYARRHFRLHLHYYRLSNGSAVAEKTGRDSSRLLVVAIVLRYPECYNL